MFFGYLWVGSKFICDMVNYGVIDLGKVIVKFSNVGVSKFVLFMEFGVLSVFFYWIGLGEVIGVGFFGESVGMFLACLCWCLIEVVILLYGYGFFVIVL